MLFFLNVTDSGAVAVTERIPGGWEYSFLQRRRRKRRRDLDELEKRIAAEKAEAQRLQEAIAEIERRKQEEEAKQRQSVIRALEKRLPAQREELAVLLDRIENLVLLNALEQDQAAIDWERRQLMNDLDKERKRRRNLVLTLLLAA